MRLLLDTHVLLWAAAAPERLGTARPIVEDERNALLVSAASTWELAIKVELGRIELPDPIDRWVPECIRMLGATGVAVEHAHAAAVAALPRLHRDPFDRLLVAQARALRATLVTADGALGAYDVDLIEV